MPAARLMLQVMVGLAPDMPIAERCRAWSYTSDDYEADKLLPTPEKYMAVCRDAMDYAAQQMDPRLNNYVRLDWIWL